MDFMEHLRGEANKKGPDFILKDTINTIYTTQHSEIVQILKQLLPNATIITEEETGTTTLFQENTYKLNDNEIFVGYNHHDGFIVRGDAKLLAELNGFRKGCTETFSKNLLKIADDELFPIISKEAYEDPKINQAYYAAFDNYFHTNDTVIKDIKKLNSRFFRLSNKAPDVFTFCWREFGSASFKSADYRLTLNGIELFDEKKKPGITLSADVLNFYSDDILRFFKAQGYIYPETPLAMIVKDASGFKFMGSDLPAELFADEPENAQQIDTKRKEIIKNILKDLHQTKPSETLIDYLWAHEIQLLSLKDNNILKNYLKMSREELKEYSDLFKFDPEVYSFYPLLKHNPDAKKLLAIIKEDAYISYVVKQYLGHLTASDNISFETYEQELKSFNFFDNLQEYQNILNILDSLSKTNIIISITVKASITDLQVKLSTFAQKLGQSHSEPYARLSLNLSLPNYVNMLKSELYKNTAATLEELENRTDLGEEILEKINQCLAKINNIEPLTIRLNPKAAHIKKVKETLYAANQKAPTPEFIEFLIDHPRYLTRISNPCIKQYCTVLEIGLEASSLLFEMESHNYFYYPLIGYHCFTAQQLINADKNDSELEWNVIPVAAESFLDTIKGNETINERKYGIYLNNLKESKLDTYQEILDKLIRLYTPLEHSYLQRKTRINKADIINRAIGSMKNAISEFGAALPNVDIDDLNKKHVQIHRNKLFNDVTTIVQSLAMDPLINKPESTARLIIRDILQILGTFGFILLSSDFRARFFKTNSWIELNKTARDLQQMKEDLHTNLPDEDPSNDIMLL